MLDAFSKGSQSHRDSGNALQPSIFLVHCIFFSISFTQDLVRIAHFVPVNGFFILE